MILKLLLLFAFVGALGGAFVLYLGDRSLNDFLD